MDDTQNLIDNFKRSLGLTPKTKLEPVNIEGRNAWYESDITDWIDSRIGTS